MIELRAAGLTATLVCAMAVQAHAQDPCAPDVAQLCKDVKPGGGRIVRCLKDNEAKLSNACRAKLAEDDQKSRVYIAEFVDACHTDQERLCTGVQPGGGRLVRCLKQHDYELGPRCSAELQRVADAEEQLETVKRQCQPDLQRLCPGAERQAGSLIGCLKDHEAELSPACRSTNPELAMESGSIVQTVEEMTSQARIADTVEILQGLSSVAFSRNDITFSYDYFQSVTGLPANANSLTFNPLLVFGSSNEFAVQLRVPVAALFPTQAGHATVSGVADVNTAFGWAFYAHGGIRQYLAVALQWNSASEPLVGAPWVVAPIYAIAIGLNRWISLTAELTYNKSFGNLGNYPGVSLLVLRPIVVVTLPSQLFVAVDTKLGWDFIKEIFVPLMRFQAGKLIGRERNVSIAAWYQLSLNTVGKQDSFQWGVGTSLSYFFDW